MEILYKELKHTLKNWNDRNYLGKQIQSFFFHLLDWNMETYGKYLDTHKVSAVSLDEILL